MKRLLAAGFAAVLIAPIVISAPAPKDADKPLAPITKEQLERAENNLKELGLAHHNHHDTVGALGADLVTKDGKPGLSWRVALLPYLEEDQLYKQFRLDEAWDSEHNMKLVDKIPKVFTPVRGRAEKGQTFLQMFAGEGTILGPPGKGIAIQGITDGTSNTFMVVEAEKPVIWTKPSDIPFDGKKVPKLGGMFDGKFHVLFGDGSVRLVPKGVDEAVLLGGITRAGGEVVDLAGAIRNVKE